MTYDALLAEQNARRVRDKKLESRKECATLTGLDRIKCLLIKDIETCRDVAEVYKTCKCFTIAFNSQMKQAIKNTVKKMLPPEIQTKLNEDGATLASCTMIELDNKTGNVKNMAHVNLDDNDEEPFVDPFFGGLENAQADK